MKESMNERTLFTFSVPLVAGIRTAGGEYEQAENAGNHCSRRAGMANAVRHATVIVLKDYRAKGAIGVWRPFRALLVCEAGVIRTAGGKYKQRNQG